MIKKTWSLNVYLTKGQKAEFKKQCELEGVSMGDKTAELIRKDIADKPSK